MSTTSNWLNNSNDLFLQGTQDLGHFQPLLSEKRPAVVSLPTTRSDPGTRQLPLPAARPLPLPAGPFSGWLQRWSGSAPTGWVGRRRRWLVWGFTTHQQQWRRQRSPPVLFPVQPHPEAAADRTRRLICVHVGRGDGEEEASHLKCARRWGSHLLDAGLLPQMTDHSSLQWHH